MKRISKNLYEACDYIANNNNCSYTEVAKIFATDRHSVAQHLDDYKSYEYQFNDFYYLLRFVFFCFGFVFILIEIYYLFYLVFLV